MRVVSWNIEMGYRPEQAARELSEIAELRSADLVLLQEVDLPASELIANRLGMHVGHAAAAVHPRTGRPFGNAVLSRQPLTAIVEVALPHTAKIAGQPRSALRATTRIDDAPVTAYSAHTETAMLPLRKRRQQFGSLASDVAGHAPTATVVVGGDFNTVTPRGVRALTEAMRAAGLEPGSDGRAPTFERMGQAMRLDHVYARGLVVIASGVSPATTASDHFPVWAQFEFSDAGRQSRG